MKPAALIVGAGSGLSAALARLLAREGFDLYLVARNIDKLEPLRTETGATLFRADASDAKAIGAIAGCIDGRLEIAVANASMALRGPLVELDPAEVRRSLEINAFGGFVTGQAAAKVMLKQPAIDGHRGTILFTGASAGVKGFPRSAPFAMGKFAQRGLAQSMARELQPQGIHVAWVNIDGMIRRAGRDEPSPDAHLDPEAIAATYLALHRQQRSAWTEELALRTWVENF